jgi:uncharacterized protein YodC (DUF2158 family)
MTPAAKTKPLVYTMSRPLNNSGCPPFDIGQLVRLKSGGPVMSVHNTRWMQPGNVFNCQRDNSWSIDCTWFIGNRAQVNSFAAATLELVP